VPASHLPIWRLVTLSYVDVWRAIRTMPVLFACAALISLVVSVVGQLLPHRFDTAPLFGILSIIVQNAVQYFCLTPVLIAIHRFVIRGDVTRGYRVDLADETFMPFFGWTMALSFVFTLVFGLIELLNVRGGALHTSIIALVAVAILFYLTAVWLPLRLIVLFPAVAVRAKGATLAHAFADTKGYGLRLLAIVILAIIPLIVIGILIALVLGRAAMVPGSPLFVIGEIIGALTNTFFTALSVVIASHVYLAIGRTVR
jgi:hypothetical protein